MITGTTTKGDR